MTATITTLPGDNPNKRYAQRRRENRPRSKNSQLVTPPREETLKWVDPLPVVDPQPIELSSQLESSIAGYVELKHDLPQRIAEPFASLFESVAQRTNIPQDVITVGAASLHSLAYLKAAKQLYSTLSDPDKSGLQPLKPIFYDTAKIPIHMGTALSMIGNFDSKLGQIEVRDGALLFKRWVAEGLKINPDTDYTEGEGSVDTAKLVWYDKPSKRYIDRICREFLNDCHQDNFAVEIETGAIQVSVPLVNATIDGYRSVNDAYPRAVAMRQAIAFLLQSERDYINRRPLQFGHTIEEVIDSLLLELAPVEYSDAEMRNAFEDAMKDYITGVSVHIDAILKTGEPTAGSTGHAAQIISSEKNAAKFQLPLSDADRALGYMFNPCNVFEINPRFVAYGRRQTGETAFTFARRDEKSIARD